MPELVEQMVKAVDGRRNSGCGGDEILGQCDRDSGVQEIFQQVSNSRSDPVANNSEGVLHAIAFQIYAAVSWAS